MRFRTLKLIAAFLLLALFCGGRFAMAGDLHNGILIPLKNFEGQPSKSILDKMAGALGTRIETEGGISDLHFRGSVTAIQPLWYKTNNAHHVFLQTTWSRSTDDKYADTISTGLAYRYLNDAQSFLLGTNIFFDHAYKNDHNRWGIGLDARTKFLGFAVNRYQALTGWKDADDIFEERALSGWDTAFSGQIPSLPSWTLISNAYTWDSYGDDDRIYGYTAGLEFSPVEAVAFTLGMRDENETSPSAEMKMSLKWRFDKKLKEQFQRRLEITPLAETAYDKVHRENRIRVAKRAKDVAPVIPAPSGYSVAFTSGPVTPANASSIDFILSGGDIGTTYDYVISSSGGGVTITGTGTVTSDPQNFNGIDVSTLQDGTMSISITLTGPGGPGPAVTDSVSKNARFICRQVAENGVVNLSAPAGEVFTSVDFASYGTPSGTCGNYTVGACHAASSAALTSAAFVGNNMGTIAGSNAVFGDPCGGTLKRFYIQLRY